MNTKIEKRRGAKQRCLRLIFGSIVAATLVFSGLHIYLRPDPNDAEAEQYAVYSEFIRLGLTGESHSLGSQQGLVVILGHTTMSNLFVDRGRIADYRFLIGHIPRLTRDLKSSHKSTFYNFVSANLRSVPLVRQFSLPATYELANEAEAALWPTGQFEERFPNNYGYLTLSRVGFNRDLTEALFYTEHACGLCGEGKFVLMRKVAGRWVVAEELWTWVS